MRRYLLLLLLGALAASSSASELESRRAEFRSALQQAERGPPLPAATRRALLDHPLHPYLEYAELRRDLSRATAADVREVLQRHADLPFVAPLRTAWLHELARRQDWAGFRAFAVATDDVELRCHAATARLAGGDRSAAVFDEIAALWRHGRSLPKACDGPFAALQAAGRLGSELRWQRLLLAAEQGNAGLMRYIARGLPAEDRSRAEAFAGFIDAPSRQAQRWKRDPHSQQIATLGLARLARRDQDAAEALLAALAAPLGLSEQQRGEVQYQIALWSAASYASASARRFAAVPAAAYDGRLHEWRAREALARGDHPAALAAIESMPDEHRGAARWRYLEARMRELAGQGDAAAALYTPLAGEPHYFGFLAADRIGAPYALCPIEPNRDAALQAAVLARPGLQRALELHALDRTQWALREWNATVPSLGDDERRLAVALALDVGWTDRAVFALANGDDQRVYSLRFPLDHDQHLRREAGRHGLDPSWVAALIRAESAWQPHARSHANARGLMQLLPVTGAELSRRLGTRWAGAASLFEPRTSITLGTAHLSELLQRYGNAIHLTTAAYNAGPTPVARWIAERSAMSPDLWIETIPYYETRDYVARILAFAVIYDWRLGVPVVPVSERMLGKPAGALAGRGFVCPLPSGRVAQQDGATAP